MRWTLYAVRLKFSAAWPTKMLKHHGHPDRVSDRHPCRRYHHRRKRHFGDGVNIAARLEGIAEPGGICISDDAYRQIRGKVEIACEDLGPQTLKNIAEPMRAWRAQLQGVAKAQSGSSVSQPQTLALPDRPSIAVLPFQNMSGNPEQEYFADGLTENITTDLSRFRELFVIGRNTAFTYKGKSIDIRGIGRELGVRYLLEGSVQQGGERLRVNVQLLDAIEGGHVWAERFDRNTTDLFAVQDEISRRVAFSLSDQLRKAAVKRLESRRSTKPESVDFVLRSRADSVAGTEKNKLFERIRLLERAAELDPQNGDALAGLARHKAILVFTGWSLSPKDDMSSALQCAERALEVDKDNGNAWFAKGQTFLALKQFSAALECYDQAVELNPSQSSYRQLQAICLIGLGRSNEAFEPVKEAIRLSPRDLYLADFYMTVGMAYWDLERYPDAIEWLTRSAAQNPKIEFVRLMLASSHLHLNSPELAATAIEEALEINPRLTIARVRNSYPIRAVAINRFTDDLLLLRLPEK